MALSFKQKKSKFKLFLKIASALVVISLALLYWLLPLPQKGAREIIIENPLSSKTLAETEAEQAIEKIKKDHIARIGQSILPDTLDLSGTDPRQIEAPDDRAFQRLVDEQSNTPSQPKTLELSIPATAALLQQRSGEATAQAQTSISTSSDPSIINTDIAEAAPGPSEISASSTASEIFYDLTWINKQNPNHYTIEAVAAKDIESLEIFVTHAPSNPLPKAVIERLVSGSRVYYLILGSFTSFADAQNALSELEEQWTDYRPWVRPLSDYSSFIESTSQQSTPSN